LTDKKKTQKAEKQTLSITSSKLNKNNTSKAESKPKSSKQDKVKTPKTTNKNAT
jgi:hypothetical protein